MLHQSLLRLRAGLLGLTAWWVCGQICLGEGTPASGASNRVASVHAAALTRYQAHTNDTEAAWQLGRAAFDLAELTSRSRDRETLALQGAAACRAAVALDPGSPAAHYYLAMNLGQLARVRPLSALRLVHQMEDGFRTALTLDPDLDYAGPDRNLGLLYREAPGWPTSIGSKSKARKHLEAAVSRSPDYPENRLNLAESYLLWNAPEPAASEVERLRKLLPQARDRFRAPEWELSWQDWNPRWTNLLSRTKAAKPGAGR